MQIQVGSDKAVRAICYSLKKRVTIQQAQENNSPVRISATKRNRSTTFNANSEEYTITKPAKITPTDVDFKVNESLAHNLITVKDCLSANIFETVDIKVKIITKSERKQPISINQQTKYQADCIVADVTGSMKLVVWEEVIDKIHSGKSYHIQGLTVRIFDDKKFVNSNEATVVSEIDDLPDVNLTSQEIQDNIITGHCIGVNIKKSTLRIACNHCLENITPEDETITCPNCKFTTFITVSKTKLVCQILLKIDEKIESYTTFNDGIYSFLRTIDNKTPVSEIAIVDLQKLLLQAGPKKMIIDRSQKLIFQYL